MDNLISLEKTIELAKLSGVNFGKGDPYNRLRYYTKIGWLPHMIRKQENSSIKGHYPKWVVGRIILIENLKSRGHDNEYITKKINSDNKLKLLLSIILSEEIRIKAVTYASFAILVFILLVELGFIKIGKARSAVLNETLKNDSNIKILQNSVLQP